MSLNMVIVCIQGYAIQINSSDFGHQTWLAALSGWTMKVAYGINNNTEILIYQLVHNHLRKYTFHYDEKSNTTKDKISKSPNWLCSQNLHAYHTDRIVIFPEGTITYEIWYMVKALVIKIGQIIKRHIKGHLKISQENWICLSLSIYHYHK